MPNKTIKEEVMNKELIDGIKSLKEKAVTIAELKQSLRYGEDMKGIEYHSILIDGDDQREDEIVVRYEECFGGSCEYDDVWVTFNELSDMNITQTLKDEHAEKVEQKIAKEIAAKALEKMEAREERLAQYIRLKK